MSGKPPSSSDPGERIAKALARAGIGSRREVERMIADGRVSLNGETLVTPAVLIHSLDGVRVDGRAVAAPAATRLWRYYKPNGLVTTHKDPQGRPTVFEKLPATLPRLISVGRLDLNSEGLLLLTNDGALARWLERPETRLARRYRVRVFGQADEASLAALSQGVVVDGVVYEPITATIERRQTSNTWLNVTLTEGKNREIRRVMTHLGLRVNRLVREAYGPFSVRGLKVGEVAQISMDRMLSQLPDFFQQVRGGISGAAQPKTNRKGWAKPKPKKRRPGSGKR